MRTPLMTAALAAFATAVTLNAQAPQSPQPPQPATSANPPAATQPAERGQSTQVITIAGCLKEEKDVAGLKPNVAERTGVTEDFILTNAKMAASSTVSGIALATRYEVEGIAESELKKHVNHQVEITGTITQATTTDSDPTADFRGTSIKMLAATCSPE